MAGIVNAVSLYNRTIVLNDVTGRVHYIPAGYLYPSPVTCRLFPHTHHLHHRAPTPLHDCSIRTIGYFHSYQHATHIACNAAELPTAYRLNLRQLCLSPLCWRRLDPPIPAYCRRVRTGWKHYAGVAATAGVWISTLFPLSQAATQRGFMAILYLLLGIHHLSLANPLLSPKTLFLSVTHTLHVRDMNRPYRTRQVTRVYVCCVTPGGTSCNVRILSQCTADPTLTGEHQVKLSLSPFARTLTRVLPSGLIKCLSWLPLPPT